MLPLPSLSVFSFVVLVSQHDGPIILPCDSSCMEYTSRPCSHFRCQGMWRGLCWLLFPVPVVQGHLCPCWDMSNRIQLCVVSETAIRMASFLGCTYIVVCIVLCHREWSIHFFLDDIHSLLFILFFRYNETILRWYYQNYTLAVDWGQMEIHSSRIVRNWEIKGKFDDCTWQSHTHQSHISMNTI